MKLLTPNLGISLCYFLYTRYTPIERKLEWFSLSGTSPRDPTGDWWLWQELIMRKQLMSGGRGVITCIKGTIGETFFKYP